MTTYEDAGVNIAAGDAASRAAYKRAASTFPFRKGMIGAPVEEEDGYAGFLDMGDHYLVMTADGTGTKMDIAHTLQKFDTLGYDLLAMVADDAVCVGAEVIAVTNCLDVPKVDPTMVDALLQGLAKACGEQKIAIPAGEIAEVPGAVNRGVWTATALGIVAKDRVIEPKSIKEGDVIISLQCGVARSNGFSLIRKILTDTFGEAWAAHPWKNGQTWGDAVLTPSIIYHDAVLHLIGRYGAERKVNVKGIAHITGGGIPGKLRRVLKKSGLGAELNTIWNPHEALQELITLGSVTTAEAYRTWNMGNGMMLIVDEKDTDTTLQLLAETTVRAQRAGTVQSAPDIDIHAFNGETVTF